MSRFRRESRTDFSDYKCIDLWNDISDCRYIYMPVNYKHGIVHIQVVKKDLIYHLKRFGLKNTSPWIVIHKDKPDCELDRNDDL